MDLAGSNAIYGKRRDETGISNRFMDSSSFLREVACLDFEALAEKR